MQDYEIVYGEEETVGENIRQLIIMTPRTNESVSPIKSLVDGYFRGLWLGLKIVGIGIILLIVALILSSG